MRYHSKIGPGAGAPFKGLWGGFLANSIRMRNVFFGTRRGSEMEQKAPFPVTLGTGGYRCAAERAVAQAHKEKQKEFAMRRSLIALAAVLVTGVATPALAAWDRIGSVDFSFRNQRETEYGNFGGSVEALALRYRDATVTCRNVTATFGNGQTRSVFRGTLARGQDVVLDIPGRDRMIRRLDFDCRANTRRGATVDISADVGRYQAEWRGSPDWDRMWSRMFNLPNDFADNRGRGNGRGNDNNDRGDRGDRGWQNLGMASFEGNRDRETTVPGWRGRQIEIIGLRPINDDAVCRNVVVTFANGQSRTIMTARRLPEDQIFQVDLPGEERNIARVSMNCRAQNGQRVAIQVLGRDPADRRFGALGR